MATRFYVRNYRLMFRSCVSGSSLLSQKTISIMKKANKKQSAANVTPVGLSKTPHAPIDLKLKGKFEVLPSPVKSFSDKKEYKVIRLENGLTACLISDMEKGTDVTSILSEESDTESDTESDDSSESDAESSKSEATDESEDDGKMKKVHKEVKLAAAALCVGVGSFSDPKEIPGLAHFLEHMVFMGSTKFPQENDFDAFIKKHGGSDNASTDLDMTTFYFECFEKHLHQAMDKFAQFFVSPLMKRESMTREREAVESEFQMAAPVDDYRKEQLLVSFAVESSPVNAFSWGNLVSLRDNTTDDKLYEALHEFRKRHYSAHRMNLAVQARLPIDTLEMYVVNCFSEVPNNGLPADDFKQYEDHIFDTPQFKRMYYVKPAKDICQVDLTWVMPSLQHMYKSKPHVYVSWLLGHEGKGSLLSYLKKKVWALSLYAGNGESGAEFNSMYASFTVNIVLTAEGFNHLKEVIEAVFSYLNLMKRLGPDARIFNEIQSIEETSFHFEEEESASDKVEELVECMQYYPPEYYLTGSELFFEYNPEAIRMVLNYLVPDKMNILILSSSVPDTVIFDKVEPWFKTQYTDKDIPAEWVQSWSTTEPFPDFAMPEPNAFLCEDFSILPVEDDIPMYPEKILNTPIIELWYRKDQKFGLPMAYYYYYLISPVATESVINSCMTQMFTIFVNMNLAEEGYPAQIAELSYSVSSCEKGLCVKLSGYNEKLPTLLELIVKYLKTVGTDLTVDVFEAVKEKQTKSFYNGFLKPTKLCKDLRLSILQNKYYTLLEKHQAMPEITFEMMKQFSEDILKNVYIQGLVQGNVTKQSALETTEKFVRTLNCEKIPTQHPKIAVNEIPTGEYCIRAMSFNHDNSNSIVTNYYQCGLLTIKNNVILEFIMLLIEEPLFDILRTKEQLGYSVFPTIRDTYGILGYTITVNAQAQKFTTAYLDERIEAFLKHTQKLLKKVNDKKFAQTKKDLIKVKKTADVDLEDEVDRNWEEIVNRKYMFDRLQREIQAIEALKLKEIKAWWEKTNIHSTQNSFRKLSVQVVGHYSGKEDTEEPGEENTKADSIDDLSECQPIALYSVTKCEHEIDHEKESAIQLTVQTTDDADSVIKTLAKRAADIDSLSGDEVQRLINPGASMMNAQDEFKLQLIEKLEEITTGNRTNNYFIKDIQIFKNQLNEYPNVTEMDL